MTLDDLKRLRSQIVMPNGVDQFVDALLAYLPDREGGPYPAEVDPATGASLERGVLADQPAPSPVLAP